MTLFDANLSHSNKVELNTREVSNIHINIQNQEQCSVIIIDNISQPKAYQNSKEIKKEIRRCKPNYTQNIQIAYQLPKGGVAFVVNNRQDLEYFLEEWPEDSFRGGTQLYQQGTTHKIILNSSSSRATIDEIKLCLADHFNCEITEILALKRFITKSGKVLPIVKVTLKKEAHRTDVEHTLVVHNRQTYIEAYHPKSTFACFNCGKQGHISAICLSKKPVNAQHGTAKQ